MRNAGAVNANEMKRPTLGRAWARYLSFGGAYASLYILGAFTQNNYILALIWPANAFMLGMLVRFPVLARPFGWISCVAGFALAVPIIGYGLAASVGLVAYNLGVVTTGYALLSRFDPADRRLERTTSILYLLSAAIAVAVFAGVVGSILIGPLFNDPGTISSFRYWFSVELLNQLIFLPMILAFPQDRQWAQQLPQLTLHDLAPIAVLVVSAVAGTAFGGMATLAFPVPALLWCAISYRVFLTSLLTFAFCMWAIVATTLGYVDVSLLDQSRVLSISMGAALVALGPLIISTTTATRNEVLDQLRYLAAEREIVSNELEHRIRNLFALVNGLISLSARDNPEMKPLANTLKNRLVALSHAHGIVHAGKAGGFASLQELIVAMLRPYETGARFNVAGDEMLVDGGIATPLALVFHELATNSAKYGALSEPGGDLAVHISRNAEDVHIDWTEKVSVPIGQPRDTNGGFGSKLLDLTIKSQLRGSYSRNFTDTGMHIEIVLPARMFNFDL